MPKTQGISARKTCPDDILVTLLNGELAFEKLAEKLEADYARATVSKYLTELYEKSLLNPNPPVQRRGRRGNYYLTEKGRRKAKTKQFVKQISEISDEFLEQFINKYKTMVLSETLEYIFIFSGHIRDKYSDNISKKIGNYQNQFSRSDWIARRMLEPAEDELKKWEFSEIELQKMWLIDEGNYFKMAIIGLSTVQFFQTLPISNTFHEDNIVKLRDNYFKGCTFDYSNKNTLKCKIKENLNLSCNSNL